MFRATIILSLTMSAVGCQSAAVHQHTTYATPFPVTSAVPSGVAMTQAHDVPLPAPEGWASELQPARDWMLTSAEAADQFRPRVRQAIGESGASRAARLLPMRTTVSNSISVDDRIQFHMAQALAASGDHDESLSHFARLAGPAVACCNLGVICYEQGDLERSRHYFEQSIERDPDLTDARVWLRWVEIQDQSIQ